MPRPRDPPRLVPLPPRWDLSAGAEEPGAEGLSDEEALLLLLSLLPGTVLLNEEAGWSEGWFGGGGGGSKG